MAACVWSKKTRRPTRSIQISPERRLLYSVSMSWLMAAWNYLWEGVRTHPFNFFTLLLAVVAIVISVLAWRAARRQAVAGERQAGAAEETVRLQAEALRSQASDTARALEIARESSDAAKASAEALQAQAHDTHAALDIAKQSAEAAERLAEANEALAIVGQRGWLIVFDTSPLVEDHASIHNKVIVRCHILFKNVGKTAINDIHVRHCEKVQTIEPTDYAGLHTIRRTTVAPNGDVSLDQLYECTPTEFSEIKTGGLRLYFYGNTTYRDIFSHLRTTRWRLAFDGNNLAACETGNEFD